jgi:hypothetical protein
MTPSGYDGGPTWQEFVERYGRALTQHALLRLLILAAALAALVLWSDSARSDQPPPTASAVEHAVTT